MREGLLVLGMALLLAVAVLAAAGTAGAAIGLFLGAILWATEAVAGPFGPGDESTGWWILGVLALVLAADVARGVMPRGSVRAS